MTRTRLAAFSLSMVLVACATTEAASPASRPAVRPAPPPAPAPGVDPAKLDAFVRSRGGIKACYQEERARDARARGRVLVRFTILETGDVGEVAVLKSELSPRMVDCVTGSLSSWQTPFRPAHPVSVELPLIFKSE